MPKSKQKPFYGTMIAFVSVVTAIIISLHYFIFNTFTSIFVLSDSTTFALAFFLSVASISFTVATLLTSWYPSKFSNFIYKISSIWLGFMFLLLIASLLSGLAQFLPISYLYISYICIALYALAFILNVYGLYSSQTIRIIEQEIKIKNLPDSWQNKRAAFVADTHYGPIHDESDAKKVVDMVNANNVDYLFHSGDFYDGPKIAWEKSANEYKKVNANIKKYFVSGNHELYAQSGDVDHTILNYIRDAGFIVVNSRVIDEDGVNIVGVDYAQSLGDISMVKKVFESEDYELNKGKPSIVLKHVPTDTDLVSGYGADLMLSGHTHNGQMFPFSLLTRYIYKGFNYGLKYSGDTAVYTTSGVGSWGPPQRLGTKSELVIFTFKKE